MKVDNKAIEKINQALDEIRPFLNNDGGDITFIELTPEGVVKVRLHGACIGCSVNQMTLKTGVEMTIKKFLPSIKSVVQVQ